MASYVEQISDKGENVSSSNTNQEFDRSNCLNLMEVLLDKSFGLDMTKQELVQTIQTIMKDNMELQEIIRESNITMTNLEEVLLDMKKKQEIEHAEVEKKSEEAKLIISRLRQKVQSLKNELEQVKMESSTKLNTSHSAEFSESVDQLNKVTKQLDQREHQISQLVQQNKKLAEERKLIRDEKEQLNKQKKDLEMELAEVRRQLEIECVTTENQNTDFGTSPDRLKTESVSIACDDKHQLDAEKKNIRSAAGHVSENVETLKAQVVSLINELTETEKKQNKILSMADHYRQRCECLEKENAALKCELDSLRCKDDKLIESLRSTIAHFECALSEQKAKNEEQSSMIEEYRIRTAELQEECRSLKIQLSEAQQQSKDLATSGAILLTLEEKRNQDDKLGSLTAQLLSTEDQLFQKQEEIHMLLHKLEQLEKRDIPYLKTQVDSYQRKFENEQAANKQERQKMNKLREDFEALHIFNQELRSQLARVSSYDECDKYAADQKRSDPKDRDKPNRLPSENVEESPRGESTQLPDYTCPKCGLKTQDYDSLAIHANDCTNECNE